MKKISVLAEMSEAELIEITEFLADLVLDGKRRLARYREAKESHLAAYSALHAAWPGDPDRGWGRMTEEEKAQLEPARQNLRVAMSDFVRADLEYHVIHGIAIRAKGLLGELADEVAEPLPVAVQGRAVAG